MAHASAWSFPNKNEEFSQVLSLLLKLETMISAIHVRERSQSTAMVYVLASGTFSPLPMENHLLSIFCVLERPFKDLSPPVSSCVGIIESPFGGSHTQHVRQA
jgi:hypothetical protein